MKHLEVHQKYSTARSIFNSLLSVSSGDESILLLERLPEKGEKIGQYLAGASPDTTPQTIAGRISAPVPSRFKSGEFGVHYTTNMITYLEWLPNDKLETFRY